MTYLVGGWAGTGLRGRTVVCSDKELAVFDPPSGQTCEQYLAPFFQQGAPGQLYNPSSNTGCQYCPLTSANQFLAGQSVYPDQRWRNFGIGWAFIVFNVSVHLLDGMRSIIDNCLRYLRRLRCTTSSVCENSAFRTWLKDRLRRLIFSIKASEGSLLAMWSRHLRVEKPKVIKPSKKKKLHQ